MWKAAGDNVGAFDDVFGGDETALRRFFQRYNPLVERTARRVLFGPRGLHGRLCTHEDILDVRQRTFEVLFRDGAERLRRYDPARGMGPDGWIEMCAHQQAHNYLSERWSHRAPAHVSTGEAGDPTQRLEDPVGRPDEHAEARQLWATVEGRLAELLTPKERLVFRLLFVEELEVEEVCALLKVSRADAYQQRHRIKDKLRRVIDEVGGGSP